jgi:hypothetical protein
MGRLAASAVTGLFAGAAGTLAMDLLWYVRYRRGGGKTQFLEWEFASSAESWEKAPAPARVGKLVYEGFTGRQLRLDQEPVTNNLMHWAYAMQWGVVLGTAIGSSQRMRLWQAPLLGALVWLASYAVLPLAGVYKPIWEYDLRTLWDDLSAHLVYGTTTATVWKLLASWST